MKINLGVGLSWRNGGYDEFVAVVEECEALGYRHLWASSEKFFRDMYVKATVVAERTTTPIIGTFVADPYTHHPALTAMAIGTLDEVSKGRAMLCLGAGGTGFPEMGIKRVKPAQAIKEAVVVVRSLLSGQVVDFEGEIIQFRSGQIGFPTRANIPIIIASRGDLVLQTAGELADGVMIATYAEPIGIRHSLAMVEQGARRAGRSLDELTLISRVDACISPDRQAAVEALKRIVAIALWTSYPARGFVQCVGLEVPRELEQIIAQRDYDLLVSNAHLVPDAFVEKFGWAGTAEDVARKVSEVVQLGIKNITFLPHAPPGDNIQTTIREFASSVAPLVEQALQ
jgi:5,10-methylenetetrahydromethanopterin reductase